MAEPAIVCENLVKIYSLRGVEIVALQGLDLTVQPGEIVGLVGASGSGKSTLLNLLGGLDRPSAGKVLVGGRDLLKLSDKDLNEYRRTQVGFVWQQVSRNLIPYLSARENIELPLRLTGVRSAGRRARSLELLQVVGLTDRQEHLPMQLSGGEQQRVAIAVALANRPLILLADEPTGEVDTATAREIYTALRQVNQVYGMTILIVSHDLNLSQYTDRVVAIRDGKTSTEMMRSGRRAELDVGAGGSSPVQEERPIENDGQGEAHQPPEFDELVVLDSAGRLQIPREYLEKLNIGDRVRLELKAGEITIQPVTGRSRLVTPAEDLPLAQDLYTASDPEPAGGQPRGWGRLRRFISSLLVRRRSLQKGTGKEA
jgi:ABC-type lipoprotein export system ATPase subunit